MLIMKEHERKAMILKFLATVCMSILAFIMIFGTLVLIGKKQVLKLTELETDLAKSITEEDDTYVMCMLPSDTDVYIGYDDEDDCDESEDCTTEPPETTTIEHQKVINYTQEDLFYLAAAICREAGGQSEEIQMLVANVIINRVNSPLFPNTIYEVLTQRMQYGMMWRDGISFPDWANENDKDHCMSVAKRILDGERVCPENVVFQAEFIQGSGIYKQFGNDYYFCYY